MKKTDDPKVVLGVGAAGDLAHPELTHAEAAEGKPAAHDAEPKEEADGE